MMKLECAFRGAMSLFKEGDRCGFAAQHSENTRFRATRCLFLCTCAALGVSQIAHGQYTIQPYTEEAVQRGLVYAMQPKPSDDLTIGNGAGIAIADLNNNGHNDIIVMGRHDGVVGFFENDGTGHFTDRSYTTDEAGNPVPKVVLQRASGIAVADYNGNGRRDVYLTQSMNVSTGEPNPDVLLRNDGDFNFTDVTEEAGVANIGNAEGAAWADIDNDGWLDLYVTNFTLPSTAGDPAFRNRLFRNRGDGTFEDVGVEQGVDNDGLSFTAAFSDTNRNGWLDLYIANDRGHLSNFSPNKLWLNDAGQYEDACDTSGACIGLWAMCVGVGDFTNNGYPDFYSTNVAHPAGYNGWNALLANQGDGTFIEQCPETGVCQLITSWAGIFFDFSNNGWLDLYVCNEFVSNTLLGNFGTFPVSNITNLANIGGGSGHSFNAAVGDITGNGALDLVLNNTGLNGQSKNVQLFINHEAVNRSWARFHVVGPDSNRYAIGSNIEVTTGSHTQWRELYAGGNNFKAQNETVFHFGLDDATVMDQIVVNWPGGETTRTLQNYPANHTWTIYPPEMLGDANGDGVIDIEDLFALLAAWGPVTPGAEIMDMNGDGVIDTEDLFALLAALGAGRPKPSVLNIDEDGEIDEDALLDWLDQRGVLE